MTRTSRVLSSLGLVVAAGCGDTASHPVGPGPGPGPAVRIAFVQDTFAVNQAHSVQLHAVGYDSNDVRIDTLTISYSVTGGAATGSASGVVQGVKPGVGTLTARYGNLQDDATLEVFGHPEGVVVGSTPLGYRPFGVSVSREGTVYVTQLDFARVTRLDTAMAVVDSIAVGAVPTGVTFSPDGATAYVTNQFSQNVGVIDVASATQVRTIAIPADPFVPFISPDGSRLFITSNTSNVYLADAASGTLTDSIVLTHAPNGFALHPDEQRVYVSTFVGGTVSEIDIAGGAVLRDFSPGGAPQGMVVSPDGTELFVANESGWLDIYDLATGDPLPQVTLSGGGFGIALSPDREHLYISEPAAGLVEVVNIPSRTIVHTLTVGGMPRRVAFTRHGGVAVIPNEAGYVSFVR